MEVISLASGATFFPSPAVATHAAISALENHRTYYTATSGLPALREAIAARYVQENQVSLSPAQVLVTPGTKQALFNVLHQIIRPGDEVLIPAPNWFGLHQVLEPLKAKLVLLPTSPEENYTLSPEKLKHYLSPKTRLFLFSNPCNPTGRIYTLEELTAWQQVWQQYPELYILSDEIYDLVTFGQRVPSLLELPDPRNQHIVVNGFSKAFAMSGWRIGYLVPPPPLLAACTKFQEATFSGVSEFVQEAACRVMADYQGVLKNMLPVLNSNRQIMREQLKGLPVTFFEQQATYYFFPDFSPFLTQACPTVTALAAKLREQQALEILPGDLFGAPGFARLSFALAPEQLEVALGRLKAGLAAG